MNSAYINQLIDSIVLPHKNKYSHFVSSEIVDVNAGETKQLKRSNCVLINVSNFEGVEPSDLVSIQNANNKFKASIAEYNRFNMHQNQVFRDSINISYESVNADAQARFEFIIVQLVPIKSL